MMMRSQEDLIARGSVFSLIFIYMMNVVILGLLMTFVSDSIGLKNYLGTLGKDFLHWYGQAIMWIVTLINHQGNL